MKIVQSFWSKPSSGCKTYNPSDRHNGGWLDKRYHYMSWALSCLQFRLYYDEVELITDIAGHDLLINKLRLPYTNVKIELDELNTYNPKLWSIGKLYAYSIQNEPFIHADGDIYIWERFDEKLHSVDLLAQNIEYDFDQYREIFQIMTERFSYVPDILLNSKLKHKGIVAVNAGILGGTNLKFFQSYCNVARSFIDKNLHAINEIDIGLSNIIFEQFLFYAMSEQMNVSVRYLINNVARSYDGLINFFDVPHNAKYIHPVSIFKKSAFVCQLLEETLQIRHPDYYYRILGLLHTLAI